ncbi:MAG TPA: carbohydrate ABC transporter permease [Geminicoccus sp.]|jgi:multiple sugar transport system permease protein|uniref:carbohydrate ABC transporter permease n=1 Tax=Geminicoccus sp. TaxID=2024832 RepID=UPI002E2F054F|nr:carbohydrate ABC transporter permease [Geminicoccus sp.]HEX2527956.1 carbohydrate ABC transporter permease [Geminicoccus sp.]
MKKTGIIVPILVWTGMTVITLLPIWWLFVVSMRTRVQLFGRPSLMLNGFYWGNYVEVLQNEEFRFYLMNSIIVATSNCLIVTILALLATFALSRYKLAAEDSLFFWLITNRMAPAAVFLLPLFLLYTQVFYLFDTRIGLILLYCVFNLPFAIWLMKGIMDGIPRELDEAAMIDGASTFQVLTKVIIPLAKPGLAVTAILTWMFAWNEYLFAATLTSVEARTITTGLAEFVTVTGTNWGELAALSMLTLAPALVFLGFVQRHIVAGLTFGAVKE